MIPAFPWFRSLGIIRLRAMIYGSGLDELVAAHRVAGHRSGFLFRLRREHSKAGKCTAFKAAK